jgi:hypothetical protein
MTSSKQIDKMIASFTMNRQKLLVQAHTIAMVIVNHAHEHNDCTRAIKLVRALPNSWQNQMVGWFKAFTPIIVVDKNDKCELSVAYKAATAENKPAFWDISAAQETPFNELSPEDRAAPVMDFAALVRLVQSLAGRIEKSIEKGTVPAEDIESAKSIARTVSGLSFQRVKPANDTSGEEAPKLAAVA